MVPFTPIGRSAVVDYAGDSTDTSITIATTDGGMPDVLYVVNEDAANIVAVNISFDANDTNAIVPTTGADGLGAVIPPYGYALLANESHRQYLCECCWPFWHRLSVRHSRRAVKIIKVTQ